MFRYSIIVLWALMVSTAFADKLERTYDYAPKAILGDWMIYGKFESGKYKYYGISEGSISVAANQFKVVTPGWFSASNVGNFDVCEKGSGRTSLKYNNPVDLYYLKFSKAPKGSLPLCHFALGRENRAQAFATFIAADKDMRPIEYYLIRYDYFKALIDLTSEKKAENALKESWRVRKSQIGIAVR